MYSVPMKNTAYIPQMNRPRTALLVARPGILNTRGGMIGLASRDSSAQKPINSATATAPKPSVWAEPHPCELGGDDRVGTEHHRRGDRHRAEHVDVAVDAGTVVLRDPGAAGTIVAIPIGTLMKKIQCQLSSCVIAPPAIRPIEAPAEIVSV